MALGVIVNGSILFQYKQILENHCFGINNKYYFFLEEADIKLARNDAFVNKEQKGWLQK